MSKRQRLAKICGADVELGNFVEGVEASEGTGHLASRALLREIPGVVVRDALIETSKRWAGPLAERGSELAPAGCGFDPQDWGRRFLPSNGGCVYVDLDHLELCVPETRGALDHVGAWHAMLRIAQSALAAANRRLPEGVAIRALVNNSDGRGSSYGSHLNFLVARRAWDDLFRRKPHHLAFLAAYQASSIVFTGQGKAGSENGAPPVNFQLAQRADFVETLTGVQTTYFRPLVNCRDEPLCGERRWGVDGGSRPAEDLARLHVIYADSTLCHVATLLKVGVLQIVLAMLEAGAVDPELALEDAVEAIQRWSHDPALALGLPLTNGRTVRAVELQRRFLDRAARFVECGGCRGVVPRAGRIVELWADTLDKLERADLAALAPRLDWVLKLELLGRALERLPGRDWSAPEIKHLDLLYASLEPGQGLYWAMERAGRVERLVSAAAIERLVTRPPAETRAFARAEMLRRAPAGAVVEVDWDRIRFDLREPGAASRWRTLHLPDPRGPGRRALAGKLAAAGPFGELLDRLGATADEKSVHDERRWTSATRAERCRVQREAKGGDDAIA
jgi:proteasome accessory factor A